MINSPSIIDVAVGILLQSNGKILLAQRPKGKIYAGYWEFPGGKIEKGETVQQALTRELQEELGITVLSSQAWCCMEHTYSHAHVRLHCFIVTDWQGNPTPCESQILQWQNYPINVTPLLPATIPLCSWLHNWLL